MNVAEARLDWVKELGLLENRAEWMNTEIRSVGLDYTIDEFAYYFPSKESMMENLLALLESPGLVLFNTAEDEVGTYPIPSRYRPLYVFAQPEGTPYRLELMTIATGISPIHGVFWTPRLFHASFKVPNGNQGAFLNACRAMSDGGWDLAQACQGTYGAFSYFRNQEVDTAEPVYLKPRVNLRDAQ